MKNVFIANSLGNENIEVLGLKPIDALEKKLELLVLEVGEEKTYFNYKI